MSGAAEPDGVALTQKADHSTQFVPFEFLAPAFRMLKNNAECVFFNTGHSDLFAKVVSRSIPYAVGIRGSISDAEAITFSSGFYAALALEKNYEKAFQMGRNLLAAMPPEPPAKDNNPESVRAEHRFFLYRNGLCEEDTETPDDFYVPKEEKAKRKKR